MRAKKSEKTYEEPEEEDRRAAAEAEAEPRAHVPEDTVGGPDSGSLHTRNTSLSLSISLHCGLLPQSRCPKSRTKS
jgi:hypothetical protein